MKNLYAKALEFLNIQKTDVLLDGFCGIGILSLLMAQKAQKVFGCECVEEAIHNAQENALHNNMANLEFFTGDMTLLIDSLAGFNKVLLNPPRKGCDQKLLEKIIQRKTETIVYISCEPQSLAQDLSFLQKNGYSIEQISLMDMFPQTYHVETVVKLTRVC